MSKLIAMVWCAINKCIYIEPKGDGFMYIDTFGVMEYMTLRELKEVSL